MAIEMQQSWGRYPTLQSSGSVCPSTIDELQKGILDIPHPIIARGMGRSYGDCCLNEDGYVILTQELDGIADLDTSAGVLRCESGALLGSILRRIVPAGWFLPVVPGTQFITVGGAIANDIHGKNHISTGSFGHHVRRFALLRSDGRCMLCSRNENAGLFRATIGGLGLTGCILWVELEVRRVTSAFMDIETSRFGNLDELARRTNETPASFEYNVAWIDGTSAGRSLGRGVLFRGNHSSQMSGNTGTASQRAPVPRRPIRCKIPPGILGRSSLRLFNFLYYNLRRKGPRATHRHYSQYFFPLDTLRNWNDWWGQRGLLGWQCVVPSEAGYGCVEELLWEVNRSRLGSLFVVLKEFGDRPPAGLLTFPMRGISLTLDMPNVGTRLHRLLDRLDAIVLGVGGRLYPAKDARMAAATFQRSFSNLDQFQTFVDPKFSSSLFRRLTDPVPS